ncbi:MAG: hypothetical protein RIA69_14575 [Cyclobacteriaceae bacterium]
MKYWWTSKNAHGLHSPFLFRFYNEVIKKRSVVPEELKVIRKKLFKEKSILEYIDPKTKYVFRKSIREIARGSLSKSNFSLFLSNLIQWQGYSTVLETGTSIGYNSLFLSKTTRARIFTIEGSQVIYDYANEFIKNHNCQNINIIYGNIHEIFERHLALMKPDLIFLDADHQSKSILNQIECIKTTHIPKCIVIHDIYWSPDMYNAWRTIISDNQLTLTVDIFEAGIVFPDYNGVKQHFKIRF